MDTPRASYRLQMHAGFGFDNAIAVLPYLADLGVSHVYCSPILQAAPGSTHGYDVIDHARVNDELGGEEGFQRFTDALKAHDLKLLLDIVPNHMSLAGGNRWWRDVLENGPASPYASYFDFAWPAEERLRSKLLLPLLHDHYGCVLESGGLSIAREAANFTLCYEEHALPLAPRSLAEILGIAGREVASAELAFIADAFGALPAPQSSDRKSAALRHRNKEVLRLQLNRLLLVPDIAAAVDAAVASFNADVDALDRIVDRQHYRLACWKAASEDLGYRRFFDVNTLIGLCAEDDAVFHDTHERVLAWVREDRVHGLRVDHPDGLADPEGYFLRLREAAPHAWILAEKIREREEALPDAWPIDGTTGYDFLALADALLVTNEAAMTEIYNTFTGAPEAFGAISHESRLHVLDALLGSDLNGLTDLLQELCERRRNHRDHTWRDLNRAVREFIACMPVYRTYVHAAHGQVSAQDARYIRETCERAKQNCPDLEAGLFDLVASVLLLESEPIEEAFVTRFQQVTGPAMAKGVEDTAFYRYHRLVSLNEVGGAPDQFGVSLSDFHAACQLAQERWPRRMLATSTHDTKRSEDVRARLHVLSEIPTEWAAAASRWSARNAQHWGNAAPDRPTEYLLYQTLVGAWPIDEERTQAYMLKAVREAKLHTNWIQPDEGYEATLREFIAALYADQDFLRQVARFALQIAPAGHVKSLALTLLKLTAPGVPDFYQGSELWEHSLVDPDNRRPVDYARRRTLVDSLEGMALPDIMAGMDAGLPKLQLIRAGLRLRREYPEAFGPESTYTPLVPNGPRAEDVVAFARGARICAIAPRLAANPTWEGTTFELPEGRWRHQLAGSDFEGTVSLTELWRDFPVALLVRVD